MNDLIAIPRYTTLAWARCEECRSPVAFILGSNRTRVVLQCCHCLTAWVEAR